MKKPATLDAAESVLSRAIDNEERKLQDLCLSAVVYGSRSSDTADNRRKLMAAAKAWTNAHHATSRASKHVRELMPT